MSCQENHFFGTPRGRAIDTSLVGRGHGAVPLEMSLGSEKVWLLAIGAVKRLITHIGGGSSMYMSVNSLTEIISYNIM